MILQRFRKTSTATTLLVLLLFATPTLATTFVFALPHGNMMHHAAHAIPLSPSFAPNAPVGGVPFCRSGALGTILCYPGQWLNTAYGFPAGFDGRGSTIVIVDAFGSPTLQADLNKYTTTFGLPAATVTILCGPTWSGARIDNCPAFNPNLPIQQLCGSVGWWEETSLDVQMSHAMATGAKIVLVVSDDCFDTSFNAAELAVVQQAKYKGSIMSQSFGEPDDLVGCLDFPCTQIDPTIKADADHIYQLAAQNQWTVLASSGDDGANSALSAVGTTELTPSWPASNPFNTAVGGTQGNPYGGQYGSAPGAGKTFSCAANTVCNTGLVTINGGPNGCGTAARPGFPSSCTPVGYGGEATWQEHAFFGNRTSSGGGVSTLYPLPSYQAKVPQQYTTLFGHTVKATGRLNPDLSLNAAIYGGSLNWLGFLGAAGTWVVFGGTSASSPSFAAVIAVANQINGGPVGFINPTVYALSAGSLYAGSFHDITLGNNSDTDGQNGVDGFVATTGYDLTTGWGTPKVATFITNLLSTLNQEGQA
jgi:subtilase family serine protease